MNTRRRFMSAVGMTAIGALAGCSTSAESPTEEPSERTNTEHQTGPTGTPLPEPFVRDQFRIMKIEGGFNEYDNWNVLSGPELEYVLGINGREDCQEISITNETLDEETGLFTVEVEFAVPDGVTCSRDSDVLGQELAVSWEFRDELPESVEVVLTRATGDTEIVSEWSQ